VFRSGYTQATRTTQQAWAAKRMSQRQRNALDRWFSIARLEEWFSGKLEGASEVSVADLYRVPGGLSAETYTLTLSWRASNGRQSRRLVLRRDPVGGLVERDIEREYRVMEAVAETDVPLPRPFALELDPGWLGRPFFVDEWLPGTASRNVFFSLEMLPLRRRLGDQFVDILGRLHQLDAGALSFLEHPGEGTAPAAREVALWEDLVNRLRVEPTPLLTEAFIWLRERLPVASRVSLVHGEYRPGNFLFEGDRIVAVLDWEYAHLGDPAEDLGWACLRQFLEGDKESGFCPRDELIDRYVAASGIPISAKDVLFWEMLGNVKVAGIQITGQHSFREGRYRSASIGGFGSDIYAEIARTVEM